MRDSVLVLARRRRRRPRSRTGSASTRTSSGTRIATDLALAWALAAAFVLVAGRPRWRRSAGRSPLRPSRSWAPISSGRPRVLSGRSASCSRGCGSHSSRDSCSPSRRPAVVALGSLRRCRRVRSDARRAARRRVRSRRTRATCCRSRPSENVAHAIDRVQEFVGAAVGVVVLVLVLQRLRVVRGVARRSQGPLLVATAVSVLVGLAWLGRVIATDGSAPTLETIARATVLSLPVAVIAVILWSRLRRPQASDLVVELRTQTPATMRERLARALGDPTLEVAYRIEGGRYVDASGRPVELPEGGDRAVTSVTAGGEDGRGADSRSGTARRAGARRIRSRYGWARARERAPGGRGAFTARGSTRVPRTDRRRSRRRASPHRAQSARRRTATARHVVARARSRSIPRRRRHGRRSLARTGRGRAGDRRATRARARNPPDALAGRRSPGCCRGAGATGAVAGERARSGAGATA